MATENKTESSSEHCIFSDGKLRSIWTEATKLLGLGRPNLKIYDEMPLSCRERHIRHGYRPNPSSFSYCVKSAFHPTNETLNFWTHFLPLLFLISRHYELSQTLDLDSDLVRTLAYPFWTYSAGCCILLGCSSFAHLFNCVSARVRHLCFCSDYGAISIYSVGGTIGYFYLVSPPHCHGFHEDHSSVYIPVATALAIACHVACCHTRFPYVKSRYLLRTLTYVLPFVVISAPTFVRLLDQVTSSFSTVNSTVTSFSIVPMVGAVDNPVPVQCTDSGNFSCQKEEQITLPQSLAHSPLSETRVCLLGEGAFSFYYPLHLIFFLFAAFFNVSRFPEKQFSGCFDVVGSSHQLFHIAIALGIISQSVVVEDALHDAIERSRTTGPFQLFVDVTAWTTLGWMSSVTAILCVIALIYGRILPCHH